LVVVSAVQKLLVQRKRLREKYLSRHYVLTLTTVKQKHILPLVSLVSKSGSIVGISCQHAAVSQARLHLRPSYKHHSVKSVAVVSEASVVHGVTVLRESVAVVSDSKANVVHVRRVEIGHRANSDHRASVGHVRREQIGHRANSDHRASVLHVEIGHRVSVVHVRREQIGHRANSDHRASVVRVRREQIGHRVSSDSRASGSKEIVVRVHPASPVHKPQRAVRVVLPARNQRHRPHKHRHLRVVQLEPPRANRGELSHVIGTITYKISSTASRSYERPGHTRLHALIW
jgi:hypothetical protein